MPFDLTQPQLGPLQSQPQYFGENPNLNNGIFKQQIFQQPNLQQQNPGITGAVNPVNNIAGNNNPNLNIPGNIVGSLGEQNQGNIFGINRQNIGLALGGLQTVGNLFSAFQQNKLAQKNFKLQEKAFNTNLKFNMKQANNSLEDRIRARFATEGRSEQAEAAIDNQRLVL